MILYTQQYKTYTSTQSDLFVQNVIHYESNNITQDKRNLEFYNYTIIDLLNLNN